MDNLAVVGVVVEKLPTYFVNGPKQRVYVELAKYDHEKKPIQRLIATTHSEVMVPQEALMNCNLRSALAVGEELERISNRAEVAGRKRREQKFAIKAERMAQVITQVQPPPAFRRLQARFR